MRLGIGWQHAIPSLELDCGNKKPRKDRPTKPKRTSKVETYRRRSRGGLETAPVTIGYPLTFPDQYEVTYPNTLLCNRRYEHMVDHRGFLQSWNNPCNHALVVNRTRSPGAQTDFFGNVVTTSPGGPKPDAYAAFLQLPYPDELTCLDLERQAVQEMRKVVHRSAQLAGSVLELLSMLWGNVSAAQKLEERWALALKVYKINLDNNLKRGLDEITSHWLAWNFAIKPLLGDLSSLLCSIDRAQRRLRWLIDHNDIPTRTHFRRFGAYKPDPLPEFVIGGPGVYFEGFWVNGELGFTPTGHDIPAEYWATCVRYDADFFASSTLTYFLDTYKLNVTDVWLADMGFMDPFSAIYEAIPFSWLVDWCTGLGNQLTALLDETSNPFKPGELSSIGYTWKITAVFDVTCRNRGTGVREHLGPIVVRRYIRLPHSHSQGMFSDPDLTGTGLLSGNHPSLGLSVAWRKRPIWKRRSTVVTIRK